MVYNLTPYWHPPTPSHSETWTSPTVSGGTNYNVSTGQQQSTSHAAGGGQQTSSSFSQTYIPQYSQTPILEGIAKYAQQMAPQVYQWGMDTYNKNQGNIDRMMKNALSYASPQRIAQDMGMAQAGVMQGAEQGRQNAMRDLQSYGIDPSSGRYAALDTANRVMSSAQAAGAGNQQRMATEATGNAMQQQAISASQQNAGIGFQASQAMQGLLGEGMKLQYSPLGTTSGSSGQSTNWNTSDTQSTGSQSSVASSNQFSSGGGGGSHSTGADTYAQGGYVPEEVSKSNGNAVDDVPANLTAGEFIIPKDIVDYKGKEFFYKLMAQCRKLRATTHAGAEGESRGGTGYARGGNVRPFKIDEPRSRLDPDVPDRPIGGGGRPALMDPKDYYWGEDAYYKHFGGERPAPNYGGIVDYGTQQEDVKPSRNEPQPQSRPQPKEEPWEPRDWRYEPIPYITKENENSIANIKPYTDMAARTIARNRQEEMYGATHPPSQQDIGEYTTEADIRNRYNPLLDRQPSPLLPEEYSKKTARQMINEAVGDKFGRKMDDDNYASGGMVPESREIRRSDNFDSDVLYPGPSQTDTIYHGPGAETFASYHGGLGDPHAGGK